MAPATEPSQISVPLTGKEIKDVMKRAKVACAALAESLGVTGGVIRTVLNAIGAAAMWLLAVVLGNPNSG